MAKQQTGKPVPKASPALYATMLPGLIGVARDHGYALAVHGSMLRDFDLIAVPWVGTAAAPEALAEALRDWLGGFFKPHDSNGSTTAKPHGRRCWSIHFGGGCYVDLSVMPRWTEDGGYAPLPNACPVCWRVPDDCGAEVVFPGERQGRRG